MRRLDVEFSPNTDHILFSLDNQVLMGVPLWALISKGIPRDSEFAVFSGREDRLRKTNGWKKVADTIQDCAVYARTV